MDMKERLQELAENARVRIEESEGLDKLNDVRVAYLGKKRRAYRNLKGNEGRFPGGETEDWPACKTRPELRSKVFLKSPDRNWKKQSEKRR